MRDGRQIVWASGVWRSLGQNSSGTQWAVHKAVRTKNKKERFQVQMRDRDEFDVSSLRTWSNVSGLQMAAKVEAFSGIAGEGECGKQHGFLMDVECG